MPAKRNQPKITVVTVVYNGEKTIENTIKSVLNQTYSNIEYIIIDGNSSDGTVGLVKKYKNKITKFVSEPDKGIYDAMNKAIGLATGQWINFLNSGDVFYNNEVISKIFSADYDFDVLYGGVILRWKFGDELCLPDKKKKEMPFCHQSCFTKTKLLKEFNFDLKYKICADRNLYKQICKKYGIHYKEYDFPVSLFDCVDSTSISHDWLMKKELMEIEEVNFFTRIGISIKAFIKFCFVQCFPKKWDELMVKRRKKSLISE